VSENTSARHRQHRPKPVIKPLQTITGGPTGIILFACRNEILLYGYMRDTVRAGPFAVRIGRFLLMHSVTVLLFVLPAYGEARSKAMDF
jgi:hypothetical protein